MRVLILGGTSASNDNGNIFTEPGSTGSDLFLYSNDEVNIHLDENNDEGSYFRLFNGSNQNLFQVDEAGNTWALGTKAAAVPTKDQGMRTLYALESTGVWFEDFGVAQLKDGVALVKIDALFAETVNLAAGYHVFLTPVDGWAALYVVDKTPTSFEVRDAQGTAGSAFDYRIVARRLGYENVRMEPVEPEAEEPHP